MCSRRFKYDINSSKVFPPLQYCRGSELNKSLKSDRSSKPSNNMNISQRFDKPSTSDSHMYEMDIISDINLEKYKKSADISSILPCQSDILAAVGDICKLYLWDRMKNFLIQCTKHYKIVFYVIGNHEYYVRHNRNGLRINDLLNKFKNILKDHPNIYLLDDSSVLLGKTLIHGSTLWSQVTDVSKSYQKPMHVVSDHNGVKTNEWNRRHIHALNGIQKSISHAQQNGYDLIMLTHYAPTFKGTIASKYCDDVQNSLYCTELSALFILPVIKAWVFGHTGYNCDYYTYGTRIISNQYDIEPTINGQNYDPNKIIRFN